MPLLALCIRAAGRVDEAGNIATVARINDEARAKLHHVKVGLALLLRLQHAPCALLVVNYLPWGGSYWLRVQRKEGKGGKRR